MVKEEEQNRFKTGVVSYVAKGGGHGVKFVDDNDWYNPENPIRDQVTEEKLKGKTVEIKLTAPGSKRFEAVTILDELQEAANMQKPEVEEELVIEDIEDIETTSENKDVGSNLAKKIYESAQKDPAYRKAINGEKKAFEGIKMEDSEPVQEEPKTEKDPGADIVEESPVQAAIKDFKRKLIATMNPITKHEVEAMMKLKLDTELKGKGNNKLTYASWSTAWWEIKKLYPNAEFHVYENENGMPYFLDKIMGIFVKVGVTIKGLEYIVHLPVMDHSHNAMKPEEQKLKGKDGSLKIIAAATTWDINKSIQRALVKAIAMHGIGLYVYKGEDLPED